MGQTTLAALRRPLRDVAALVELRLAGQRADVAMFAVLALIQLAAIAHHTTWRDEHQAWLIAGASGSLGELWANMRYEGHPPLWHAVLWAAQWISTDLAMLKLTQCVIALTTLGVVVFLAPFPLALRGLIGLNYFMLFEYGVFARAYGLGAMLFLLALAAWRFRIAWLLLALSAFASLHFMLLAGAMGLVRVVRRGIDIPGLAVLGAGCLLSLYGVWPHPDTVRPIFTDSADIVTMRTILYSGLYLWPVTPLGGWFHLIPHSAAVALALVAALAISIVLYRVLAHDVAERALVMTFLAGMTFLSVVAYPLYPRHAGTLVLLVIALFWLRASDGHEPTPGFVRLSAWLAAVGLVATGLAFATNFSGGHLASREIVRRGLAERTWATYPAWHSLDIAAVTGRPALSLQQDCLQTFQIWNFPAHHLLPPAELRGRIEQTTARAGGTLHMMTSEDLGALSGPGLNVEMLHQQPRDQIGDTIRLYRVTTTAAAPQDAQSWPICAVGDITSRFARRR